MDQANFARVVDEQLQKSLSTLTGKAKEYATDDDRLANFKFAANLQGITPMQALAGMMAKHTYSIFQMISSGKEFNARDWDEKITDHVNYLLLLRALVEEVEAGKRDRLKTAPATPQQQTAQVVPPQQPTPPSSGTVKTGQ